MLRTAVVILLLAVVLLTSCKCDDFEDEGVVPSADSYIQYDAEYNITEMLIGNLHEAAARDNVDAIKATLDKDSTVLNKRDSAGNTALRIAVRTGSVNALKELINRGAFNTSYYQVDRLGRTLLHDAVIYSNVTVVKTLLDESVASKLLDKKDSVNSSAALHHAARLGKLSILKLLLDQGADIEVEDNGGRSPFVIAAMENRPKIVLLLNTYNANVKNPDSNGNNALHYAAKFNNEAVVAVLLDNIGIDANILNNYKQTPLHIAVRTNLGTIPSMDRLFAAGADPDARDYRGWTPLAMAAALGLIGKVEYLVANNATVACYPFSTTPCPQDPLQAAIQGDGSEGICKANMPQMVETLLNKGALVHNTNYNSELCMAVRLANTLSLSQCPLMSIAQTINSLIMKGANTKVVCSASDCGNQAVVSSASGARHPTADPYDFRVCLDRRPDLRSVLNFLQNKTDDVVTIKAATTKPPVEATTYRQGPVGQTPITSTTQAPVPNKCAPVCTWTCAPVSSPFWVNKTIPQLDY